MFARSPVATASVQRDARSPARARFALVVLAACLACLAWLCVAVMPFENGLAWDSTRYAAMATHPVGKAGVEAPFAFRLLTPWLASKLPGDWAVIARFQLLDLAAFLAMALASFEYFDRSFAGHRRGAFIAAVVLIMNGLFSLYAFCPVSVDLPSMAFAMIALAFSARGQHVAFSASLAIAAASKELGLWPVVDHVLRHRHVWLKAPWKLPVLCFAYVPALLVFIASRHYVDADGGAVAYYVETILGFWEGSTHRDGPIRVLVAIMEAEGVPVIVAVLAAPSVWRAAKARPEIAAYFLTGTAFVLIGGKNLVLFAFHASPALLALLVPTFDRLRHPAIAVAFATAVLLRARPYLEGWPRELHAYERTGAYWMTAEDLAARLFYWACVGFAMALVWQIASMRRGARSPD